MKGQRLKKRDRKALGRYIRQVADLMELHDWHLHLMREPCDEDCNAQTRLIYGRKVAEIRVVEGIRLMEPERIRQTITHELVHCHFAAISNQVAIDLPEHLGKQAAEIFYEAWLRNFEYGVDAIAAALAPSLPLIEWPECKGK